MLTARKLFLLAVLLLASNLMADTRWVTQPLALTNESHYARGPSALFDGTNYWLFFGRSKSFDGWAQTGQTDRNDYEIYYKKAPHLQELIAAPSLALTTEANLIHGKTAAAVFQGKIWVMGISDPDPGTDNSDAAVFAWYTSDDGATWTQSEDLADDIYLNDQDVDFDMTVWGGRMWLLTASGDFYTQFAWNNPQEAANWGDLSVLGTDYSNGKGRLYADDATLYELSIADFPERSQFFSQWSEPDQLWTRLGNGSTAGSYPTLFKVGDAWAATQQFDAVGDGTHTFLRVACAPQAESLLSATNHSLSEGRYRDNTWSETDAAPFEDEAGNPGLLFSSERDQLDQEATGQIWWLNVSWNVSQDHYTYLQNALDAATPGDDIVAGAGAYNESLNVSKSITLLGAQDGVAPGADGSRPNQETELSGRSSQVVGINFTQSNATVKGLTITNFTQAGIWIDNSQSPGLPITIAFDRFLENGWAVDLNAPGDATIQISNNWFADNFNGIRIESVAASPSRWTGINLNQWAQQPGFAIENLGPDTLNASFNWWGSPSGPTQDSNLGGSGSRVTGGASPIPWCLDSSCRVLMQPFQVPLQPHTELNDSATQAIVSSRNWESEVQAPQSGPNRSLNLSFLLESTPQGHRAALDGAISVSAQTEHGQIDAQLPSNETISAPDNWEGEFDLPHAVTEARVPPSDGNTISDVQTMELGSAPTSLEFDLPLRILWRGRTGKNASIRVGGDWVEIVTPCLTDSLEAQLTELAGLQPKACTRSQGNDLIIWTMSAGRFQTYQLQAIPTPGPSTIGSSATRFTTPIPTPNPQSTITPVPSQTPTVAPRTIPPTPVPVQQAAESESYIFDIVVAMTQKQFAPLDDPVAKISLTKFGAAQLTPVRVDFEIRDETGKTVWRGTETPSVNLHEEFLKTFDVPGGLPPGGYTAWAQVTYRNGLTAHSQDTFTVREEAQAAGEVPFWAYALLGLALCTAAVTTWRRRKATLAHQKLEEERAAPKIYHRALAHVRNIKKIITTQSAAASVKKPGKIKRASRAAPHRNQGYRT